MSDRRANEKGGTLARSIRALARQMARNESTVRKWKDRDDWPFSRTGPWDVQRVRAWAEIHLKPDPAAAYRKKARAAAAGTGEFAEMGALTKARVQATLERALWIRQRRLAEGGKLHDVGECERRRLRQIYEVKGALLALPRSVANALVGLDRAGIERMLDRQMTEILEGFAGGDEGQDKTSEKDAE
ncbi:MAG TPA: hypothetical protein VMY35_19415 [Phycisphaerae bacterium]|nr:hypothetical protein [Phycisphaerae bacterium]